MIRDALESDLPAIAEMLDDFVKDHPASRHVRPIEALRAAHFGPDKVASLVVATRRDQVIGMVQWSLYFDMFWAMKGMKAEFLYVRPEARGLGIAPALIADICARGRSAGAVMLNGASFEPHVTALYERFAMGWPSRECHICEEAFQVLADLAGSSTRDIVRGLPAKELNRVPAKPR
ncbi:MAG: GNAT family N-acetyltransferase [Kofleriaceae bacterium]